MYRDTKCTHCIHCIEHKEFSSYNTGRISVKVTLKCWKGLNSDLTGKIKYQFDHCYGFKQGTPVILSRNPITRQNSLFNFNIDDQ